MFFKISQISQKNICIESLFNKVARMLKKPILNNICEQLLSSWNGFKKCFVIKWPLKYFKYKNIFFEMFRRVICEILHKKLEVNQVWYKNILLTTFWDFRRYLWAGIIYLWIRSILATRSLGGTKLITVSRVHEFLHQNKFCCEV